MPEMKSIIEKGNIIRTQYLGAKAFKADDYVNLYLGSGRFGGSFDALGVMNKSYSHWARRQEHSGANTVFMHADHWSRGKHGMDFHLPVARILWDNIFDVKEEGYKQELNIYDGNLKTHYTSEDTGIAINSYFHPYNRDVFAMEIEYASTSLENMPSLILNPETNVYTQYDNDFQGVIVSQDINQLELTWKCRFWVGNADTVIYIRLISSEGGIILSTSNKGLTIKFDGTVGKHLLLMGVSAFNRSNDMIEEVKKIDNQFEYSKQCEEAWHKRWGESWLQVPDDELQAMWARSVYYLLCSYSPDPDCISPAMGWSGNSWNFHFPQDFSYVLPALLRLGHIDIAKAKIEFYRSCLEATVRNTKRIYGYDGAMWAWEHPIGNDFNILEGEIFNWCLYEIHNAAYPSRVAYETALHVNDDKWTRIVAWPIIEESARFYGSSLKRDEHGRWNLKIEPSFGQDEAGGYNATNYLCALFSAKYCLKIALKLVEKFGLKSEEYTKWQVIINEGLAFPKLYNAEKQLYYTCEEAINSEFKQKHPVQLNPLIFLPLEELDQTTVIAYKNRYELCAGVKNNTSYGWTLGAYWLAASHMRDGNTLLSELKKIQTMNYADQEYIQFYETSRAYMNQYYTTTHGLYLQALNDVFVSDYWGGVEIGVACPDEWENSKFNKFYTKYGQIVSGNMKHSVWSINIEKGR
jgi:hypothetical protein